ncbi:MAG TPA: DUF3352 domain-containing protein [Solirubrobacteraceae bacterium]
MPRLIDKLPLRKVGFGALRERRPSVAVPRDRRALVAVAAVIVVVLIVLIASSGGQAITPPATGAASVVPSDALAYIHVSTDESRSAVKSALALAARFPGYAGLRDGLLARLGATGPGVAVDFASEVRPWLGKEVAFALFDTSTSTSGSLIVVAVAHRRPAERFVAGLPTDGSASYEGTTITGHPGAGDTAFVGRYLLIGHSASLRAAIDVADRRAPSLSEDPSYRRATASEPAGRAVDAYVSGTGVTRLLTPRHGLLGVLGALLYQPTLEGVAVALTPASGGVHVRLSSVLDPQLAHPTSPSFTPSLGASVPAGAGLFLDVMDLNRVLPHLLTTIGIGAQIPKLLEKLGVALTAEGVNVEQNIVSLFERESAVVISSNGGKPVVTVVARTAHPGVTRTAFAELEEPLERLFAPAGADAGRAPVFNQVTVGGVAAHQLVLVPGLQFDYAVFGDKLVLSTSLEGIAAVARHAKVILDQPAYQLALGDRPARVTSLLFLDLNQLLSLDEQTGLISGARFLALKPDLERVHAIGLDSTSGEAESTAELFLQIS